MAALDLPRPEIRFDSVAFSDVISSLNTTQGVVFDVDWDRLAKAGISRDAPVSLRLRNVKLNKILHVLCEMAQPDPSRAKGDKLEFLVGPDGHVIISTAGELFRRYAETKRYPIGDLVTVAGQSADDLREQFRGLVTEVIALGQWSDNPDIGDGSIKIEGDDMIIHHRADVQVAVADLLEHVRKQARATTKPSQ